MVIEPIKRVRIYEEIVKRLEAQILSGRLVPGDMLPSERDLMEHYGVGRPAVREAVLTLQKAGLITIQNGERARVCAPSAASIIGELGMSARYLLSQENGVAQFQQARQFFEVGLVRYAAQHATEEDTANLQAALRENENALDDMDTFAKTDVAFHFVLAEIPRNPIFVALHYGLAEWLTEQRATTLTRNGAAADALRSHKAIFAAIRARDPDSAENAMRRHLEKVRDFYWNE